MQNCIKLMMLAVLVFMCSACRTVNVAWYGQIYNTEQTATTEGSITHNPKNGDISTSVKRDYDTSTGTPAKNENDDSKKTENGG